MSTLTVIDVAHLAWQAWHARTSTSGAFDGLRARLAALSPGRERLVLAVDLPPYERASLYPPYKATRRDDAGGREAIKGFLAELRRGGWQLVGARGHEADDVIATLVAEGERRGVDVEVVTGDKDLWCLAERCHLLATDGKPVDRAAVAQRFGVAPRQLPDLLSLAGDAADNIPGAAGLGPAKASTLLIAYGSVEELLAVAPLTEEQIAAEAAEVERLQKAARKKAATEADVAIAKEAARKLSLARLHAQAHASRDDVEISARLVALRCDLSLDFATIFGDPRPVAEVAAEAQAVAEASIAALTVPPPVKEIPSMPDPAPPRPVPSPAPQKPRQAPPSARPAYRAQGPAPSPAPVPSGRLRLSQASAGLVSEPLSLLVYGVEGVGKTSFAAAAPSPLILGAEAGSAEIGHVQRLSPSTFEDVLSVLEDLRVEQHPYRTVAIDSLDWLEPLVWRHVCEKAGKSDIEAFGYGKGYVAALDAWRVFLRGLDRVRERGVSTVLLAHSVCKAWHNPDATQADYDRYTLKLNDKAAGLAKEWSKAVLFANFERATVEKDHRAKGIDTGRRLLHTRMSAAFDAKNRLWLPAELPLGWAPFARAVRAGAELRARFYTAIATMGEEGREAAIEHMEQHSYAPEAAESVIASASSTAA